MLEWDACLDDASERRHVAAPWHAAPVHRSERVPAGAKLALAALTWSGRNPAEAAPWQVVTAAAGRWSLVHPHLGKWEIAHWALPSLPV